MYCRNCGTALPDTARACPTCGVQFAPPLVDPGASAAGTDSAVAAPVPMPESAATIAGPGVAPEAPPRPPRRARRAAAPTTESGQPTPRKRRTGLIVAVVLGALAVIAAGVAAAMILLPGLGDRTPERVAMPPAYAPMPVDLTFKESVGIVTTTTAGTGTEANAAAETAVLKFYDAINGGDIATAKKLLSADTRAATSAGSFEGWTPTTFTVAWSAIDGNTGYVYGMESQRQFGSEDLGVKFSLVRVSGAWLIQAWTGVDATTVNGGTSTSGQGTSATALNESSARDVVTSLLKARQQGDAETIRLLTTAKFQAANGTVWLDGSDNSAFFTEFTIKSVNKKGSGYAVVASELWNSGVEIATYTVVNESGTVLVDTWSSK